LRLAEKSATELSEFLKKMFGRYISTEVMNSLIENPSTTELGGEKRNVTIMISDLRGFTSLSERLEPEQVVTLLNNYFEMMVDIIFQYNGTINEIIGDGLVVIFGAPKSIPDQTQNAIACAIEMQNAMQEVNRQNRALELPELEMGIGLNETEVIVGNIGSSKRTKYGAIGSGMNQAARIESYTVGGQILVSESILKENGKVLRVDQQFEVYPKGSDLPLKIYDIGGIAGNYNLSLESEHLNLQILAKKIPVKYTILEGKHVGRMDHDGYFVKLSSKSAEMVSDRPLETLINLKISLENAYEGLARTAFYAKVVKSSESKERHRLIQFTSVPPEIISYFQAHLQYALEPCPDVVKKQKT
ncbi:MAG: adenylate/guanylate cyclase domain-containing protein, partial [Deltaproteobacteria bacterium]|nr:adenylate/guanylate cyclase domain-containing protein [Deltaproteobacteria bacterium]